MPRKQKKTSEEIVATVDAIIAESLHGIQVAIAGLAKIPDPQMEIRVLLPDGRIRKGKTKGMPDNAVPTLWDMEISAQEYARQCFMCIFGGVATDSAEYPTQDQMNYFFVNLADKIEWELEDKDRYGELLPPLRNSVSAQEYARRCFMCILGGRATDSAGYPTQDQVNYFFFALADKIEWERKVFMPRKYKKTTEDIVKTVDAITNDALLSMYIALMKKAKIHNPQIEIHVLLPDGRIRRGKTEGMPDNSVPAFWNMEMEATK